jgi:hypothetical protein
VLLRVFLVLVAAMAIAGPALADDMETCRDKQAEAKENGDSALN